MTLCDNTSASATPSNAIVSRPTWLLRAFCVAGCLALLGTAAACDAGSPRPEPGVTPVEPTMVAQPGNVGWGILFTRFPAVPQALRVRVGENSPFRSLRGMAFTLPTDTPRTSLTMYYTLDGEEHGPYTFVFDPDIPNPEGPPSPSR